MLRSCQSSAFGKGLGAGHQHGVVDAGRHEGGRHGQSVDEARAARLNIEGAGAAGADALGDHRRGRREHRVGYQRGADHEVDVVGGVAEASEQVVGRLDCQVGGRLIGPADAPLADAGARRDPLVGGVDGAGELIVREDALGDRHPEGRDLRSVDEPPLEADHRSSPAPGLSRAWPRRRLLGVGQGEHELTATGGLATDGGVHLAAAHRAAGHGDLDPKVERIARRDDALEPHLVDTGEQDELAPVGRVRQRGHDARLSERLDDQHAGHDGITGKVAREPPVVVADEPAGVAALARDELDDLVEQQERRTMGDELLDLLPVRGRPRRSCPNLVAIVAVTVLALQADHHGHEGQAVVAVVADATRHAAGQHAARRARQSALESRRLGLRLDGRHDAIGKAGRDVDCDLARGLQHGARGGQTLQLGGAVAAEAQVLAGTRRPGRRRARRRCTAE